MNEEKTGMRAYEELKDIKISKEQEEMMNIICDAWEDCRKSECQKCADRHQKYMRIMACTSLKYTRLLLENGYRKSEAFSQPHENGGEWIRYPHNSGIYCSLCKYKRRYRDIHDAFCPNCGAKMKGGAEQ